MGKQIGFSEIEYGLKRKKTRREIFLEKMERIVPIELFCDCIRPHYYVKGNGRQPIELGVMVKMYLISHWYNLSDEGTEDLIYENQAVRKYVGIDLSVENAPDRTTLCKFRHLLEREKLNGKIFEELTKAFERNRLIFKEGAIVDATIIEAPESRKNKERKRDEEMSVTRKNSRYYFGFKANTAVDEGTGIVKKVVVTTASVADIEAVSTVLSGDEKRVGGDAGYIGIEHRSDICEKYQDKENPGTETYYNHKKGKLTLHRKRADIEFVIARKRAGIRKLSEKEQEIIKEEERAKSKTRAKVEHPYRIVKQVFGFRKTRYRGLSKNENKMYMLFALANLYLAVQKNKILTITR